MPNKLINKKFEYFRLQYEQRQFHSITYKIIIFFNRRNTYIEFFLKNPPNKLFNLSECRCIGSFARNNEYSDARALVSEKIVLSAEKFFQQNSYVHIVVIGSGYLLHELILLALLVRNNITRIKLDLIDPIYKHEKTYSTVKQFLSTLFFGLGLKIKFHDPSVFSSCEKINRYTNQLSEQFDEDNYTLPSNWLDVTFFSKTKYYPFTENAGASADIFTAVDFWSESLLSDFVNKMAVYAKSSALFWSAQKKNRSASEFFPVSVSGYENKAETPFFQAICDVLPNSESALIFAKNR
ncbi:MAG: hypothetical protein ACD_29C00249G0002 [uncultured bacterium]|nr:MAG: hypothetical protein ACD_29C00249G0002 [uncultured bacterium]